MVRRHNLCLGVFWSRRSADDVSLGISTYFLDRAVCGGGLGTNLGASVRYVENVEIPALKAPAKPKKSEGKRAELARHFQANRVGPAEVASAVTEALLLRWPMPPDGWP